MKLNKLLAAAVEEFKADGTYYVEDAKLKFAVELEHKLRQAGMNYADLAKKLGTSPAYITKIIRGDANLTIESMVKLCTAVGSELDISVREKANPLSQWDISQVPRTLPGQVHARATQTSATVVNFPTGSPYQTGSKSERLAA